MKTVYFALMSISISSQAFATFPIEVKQRLKNFQIDSAKEMSRKLTKYDSKGKIVDDRNIHFSDEDIRTKNYLNLKSIFRSTIINTPEFQTPKALLSPPSLPFERIKESDDPKRLVDNPNSFIDSFSAMHSGNLISKKLSSQPWSDDYWPHYKGILGVRYADPKFPHSSDWNDNYQYILENPAGSILGSAPSNTDLNRLSPSEKYDLLVGDSEMSLTKSMWKEGKHYYDTNGEVETWFGICHGWAPAAYMLPRPEKSIDIHIPSIEQTITFFPSDIKALSSLIWAKAAPRAKFIGGRCNVKDPEVNDNGRITSDECFDSNPASWHLSVVNQVGVSDRGMVLDASYDYEVWNQPIYSYSFEYFNPETNLESETLEESMISLEEYSNDKFPEFRDVDSKFIVGVVMKVSYMVETRPTHAKIDSPSRDSKRSVYYIYDIELDKNKKIIGGEWHTNHHPDFLWTPLKGSEAKSYFDNFISGSWKLGEEFPPEWKKTAQRASQSGMPLANIIELLTQNAQLNQ